MKPKTKEKSESGVRKMRRIMMFIYLFVFCSFIFNNYLAYGAQVIYRFYANPGVQQIDQDAPINDPQENKNWDFAAGIAMHYANTGFPFFTDYLASFDFNGSATHLDPVLGANDIYGEKYGVTAASGSFTVDPNKDHGPDGAYDTLTFYWQLANGHGHLMKGTEIFATDDVTLTLNAGHADAAPELPSGVILPLLAMLGIGLIVFKKKFVAVVNRKK